jgi:hypothetical protein
MWGGWWSLMLLCSYPTSFISLSHSFPPHSSFYPTHSHHSTPNGRAACEWASVSSGSWALHPPDQSVRLSLMFCCGLIDGMFHMMLPNHLFLHHGGDVILFDVGLMLVWCYELWGDVGLMLWDDVGLMLWGDVGLMMFNEVMLLDAVMRWCWFYWTMLVWWGDVMMLLDMVMMWCWLYWVMLVYEVMVCGDVLHPTLNN